MSRTLSIDRLIRGAPIAPIFHDGAPVVQSMCLDLTFRLRARARDVSMAGGHPREDLCLARSGIIMPVLELPELADGSAV